ncbi:hypothetical protein AF332_25670 [Sporosarcina globispora]|uniref:GNAT family acetyltransferase n=1 Tax=Sporosarcina globispora TaxID=1459 RepID=A0A0M0GK56_SPOGL|nr:hypothetical protein [Sporosarcina globispora]KON89872.1 hypothetical protein AF332_25670 [Sporosarcina globispora]
MKYTLNQITPEELIESQLNLKSFLQSQMYADQKKITSYRDLFETDLVELFNCYKAKEAI